MNNNFAKQAIQVANQVPDNLLPMTKLEYLNYLLTIGFNTDEAGKQATYIYKDSELVGGQDDKAGV